ncbi:MAG: AIR synthase family protein [Anaerolineales bacterium]
MKDLPGTLSPGKLPPALLAKLLSAVPSQDKRVVLGPGIGLDCAVVDIGSNLLVFKSDPITFATDQIGWYAVQINANDIATTGALPAWFLVTLLLPPGNSKAELVEEISQQVYQACQQIGVTVIGGHSEITHAVNQPIIMGTLIGEVSHEDLVTPKGAQPGDRLLLTKGIPIEAVSILAREFSDQLRNRLSPRDIKVAQEYLHQPGISILKDALVATKAGRVTAMHDPTEGGLAAALWELAQACGHTLVFYPHEVFISPLAENICALFDLDPLAAIASGALLLAVPPDQVIRVRQAMELEDILCSEIGVVESGAAQVWVNTNGERTLLPYPERDELARLFDSN